MNKILGVILKESHVDAHIRLHWYTENEGGRNTIPIGKVYGTNMGFEKDGPLWSIVIFFQNATADEMRNQVVELAFLFPEKVEEKLTPGKRIFIYDGPEKLIADGEIISVYE
jgi:hypothetical protein